MNGHSKMKYSDRNGEGNIIGCFIINHNIKKENRKSYYKINFEL